MRSPSNSNPSKLKFEQPRKMLGEKTREGDAGREGGRVPPGSVGSFKPEEAYGDNATPAVDRVKVDKMEELGALLALLAGHKNVNDQLANDLEASERPMVSTDELEKVEKENKALYQTISEHKHDIAAQTTKINELKQAVFDLSGEIARGRHVPPKTHIFCMAENPDQACVGLRQAAMDRIKGENEALIKRLKELEENMVLSNTTSQTGRRAGAAGAETEHSPLVLVMAVVKPSPDDARSDARSAASIRGTENRPGSFSLRDEKPKYNTEPARDPSTAQDSCNIKSEVEG
ncbi:hypothetical protein BKA70DRAFT_1439329 [Coprinopsis sp. MPI-PUGE-AT-0042]|nr:hypothetical protein BKA70DRAFT_1439329 [Coprinopsis sp. MPI-PUGE-AT-0042]